jgi:hypothetical protein
MTSDLIVGGLAIAIIAGLMVYFRLSTGRRMTAYYAERGSAVASEQDKYADSDERRFLDEDELEARRGSRESERRHRDES